MCIVYSKWDTYYWLRCIHSIFAQACSRIYRAHLSSTPFRAIYYPQNSVEKQNKTKEKKGSTRHGAINISRKVRICYHNHCPTDAVSIKYVETAMFLYQYKRENILININNRLFHDLFDDWNAPADKQVCRLSSICRRAAAYSSIQFLCSRIANARSEEWRQLERNQEKRRYSGLVFFFENKCLHLHVAFCAYLLISIDDDGQKNRRPSSSFIL